MYTIIVWGSNFSASYYCPTEKERDQVLQCLNKFWKSAQVKVWADGE